MDLASTSGQLTLRLAALLSMPFSRMKAASLISKETLETLSASDFGQRALNRAMVQELELDTLEFSPRFVIHLATNDRMRLAAQLVLSDQEVIDSVILTLAAALVQRRIRSAVLRRDRARLEALLGADAFGIGLRRAPVFAPALGDLGAVDLRLPEDVDEAEITSQDNPLYTEGRALVHALLHAQDPALARLLLLQVPGDAPRDMVPNEAQQAEAWRLIEQLVPV